MNFSLTAEDFLPGAGVKLPRGTSEENRFLVHRPRTSRGFTSGLFGNGN